MTEGERDLFIRYVVAMIELGYYDEHLESIVSAVLIRRARLEQRS